MELQSAETKDLVAALVKLQGELKPTAKDAKNPHYKSAYASLEAIIDWLQPMLNKHGFAVTQQLYGEGGYFLVTQLDHVSGQWKRSYYPVIVDPNPQKLGSCVTYARRYSLKAIINLAETDDDGESVAQDLREESGESYDDLKERGKKNQTGPISAKQFELLKLRAKNKGLNADDVLSLARKWNPNLQSVEKIGWGYFDDLLKAIAEK